MFGTGMMIITMTGMTGMNIMMMTDTTIMNAMSIADSPMRPLLRGKQLPLKDNLDFRWRRRQHIC